MIPFLLNIAKTKVGGLFVGFVFSYLNTYLPVDRLYETENLLAFYHPKPNYAVHILIVPKRAIASYKDLSEDDQDFLMDVFRATQFLVEELSLEESGYRLILNGGVYQKVPQLHFHLVADECK